jgi:CxxC motif-containing protein (DUF1111 family)
MLLQTFRVVPGVIGVVAAMITLSHVASAVSPASVEQGRQLFERDWPTGNPAFGSDGLGPLFNARSCVACHHQGGVGGGGDSRFNAQAIGIERMDFSGNLSATTDQKLELVRSFYPGFIQTDGSLLNTASLPHHGGSSQFEAWRSWLLGEVRGLHSKEGGSVDANAVRLTHNTPILFNNRRNGLRVFIQARLFQRNTTPLFGSGLIDAISDADIERQAKIQERHPEISGRVSVLRDGTIGRFGWRANVSRLVQFVDRACANELSLETERRPQGVDPSRPSYRNPAVDIKDAQIQSMSDFIATLPRPIQLEETDSTSIAGASRGRRAFEAIGCAVCHIPNLVNVSGLYSDLLLHDMGPSLYDFDAAEPYVVRQRLSYEARLVAGTERLTYYGAPTPVSMMANTFVSPRGSIATEDFVTVAHGRELGPVPSRISRSASSSVVADAREELGIKRNLKPSNTSQEWRTPPLWGVRDSAPYMHDGRAETLLEAIAMHEGEAAGTRDRFLQLPLADRRDLIGFLETLVAPPNLPLAAQ